MADRPRTRCPTCGEMIEPDEPNIVEAVELRSMPGQGAGAYDVVDGMSFAFHERCFPTGDPRYRRL